MSSNTTKLKSNTTKKQTLKKTREYTCTRRIDKLGKKIWVVLEDGRKFYRIFKIRSLAISYFTNLKTVYAEMLVQDLTENIFTNILYTKLKVKENNSLEEIVEIKGDVVEDSDTLFDEETFFIKEDSNPINKIDDTEVLVVNDKNSSYNLSSLNNFFPKEKPIISNIKINIDTSKSAVEDKTLIKDEFGIKIYQSDINLSVYLLGEEFYEEQKNKDI